MSGPILRECCFNEYCSRNMTYSGSSRILPSPPCARGETHSGVELSRDVIWRERRDDDDDWVYPSEVHTNSNTLLRYWNKYMKHCTVEVRSELCYHALFLFLSKMRTRKFIDGGEILD